MATESNLDKVIYWLTPNQGRLRDMIADNRLNELSNLVDHLRGDRRLNYDQIAYVFETICGLDKEAFEDLMYVLDERGEQ